LRVLESKSGQKSRPLANSHPKQGIDIGGGAVFGVSQAQGDRIWRCRLYLGHSGEVLDPVFGGFVSWGSLLNPKLGGQIAQNRSKSDDKFVDSVRSQDFLNAGLTPHSPTTTYHELKIGHPPGFLLF